MWTVGCLAFLVHVVAAFHVHYDWSHTTALRETARQSAELTGRAVAAGLYLNYLFAALWAGDVLWCWHDARSHGDRPAWMTIGLHAFMLFVLFNGTVIFGRGPVRWLGAAATLAGVVALAARQRGSGS
jgi:hypothetical protein